MIYTGIGSRKITKNIELLINDIGCYFGLNNHILRSGGANGSDMAFELGCDMAEGLKEIYLPWEKFNDNNSKNYIICENAMSIAKKYHPFWNNLNHSAKLLHSRNIYQILGADLNTPSDLLICWTPDGCENKKSRNINTGGTGTAIMVADDWGIPIINLNNTNYLEKLSKYF